MFGRSVLVKLLSVLLINGTIKPGLSIPIYNSTIHQHSKYACGLTEWYDIVYNFCPSSNKAEFDDGKGISLHLIIRVIDAKTCSPLSGAYVDICHENASTESLLRAKEPTNSQGDVRFATVIPGWSNDEALHVSIQIFHGNNTIYKGRLFFDENLFDGSKLKSNLSKIEPYATNGNNYSAYNEDSIYLNHFKHNYTLLSLTTIGAGFQTIVTIVVDPERKMMMQSND